MTVEENIRFDAKRLEKISKDISMSQARKVVYDFSFLSMLIETAGVKKLYPSVDFKSLDDGENIVYTMEDNLEQIERLANRVLKMFKKMDFYCYFNSGYTSLSVKDKTDILYSFLDEFLPELLKMYKKMYEDNHIFLSDLGDNLGQSYVLQAIDSYYVAINVNQENDLNNLETIVHELLHVYSMHFLRNYDWKKTQRLLNGLSSETIPLYGELAFFDYLVRNNILKEDAYFHRNLLDYNILEFFKIIKFFCYFARKDKDNFHFPGGLTYEYKGEGKLSLFEGIPFMNFDNSSLRKSELVNFAYGIGSVEAYNLFRIEKNGLTPKEIIDSFLIRQGDNDHLKRDIFNTDLSFMSKEIQKHQLVLENIRPIPGYHR